MSDLPPVKYLDMAAKAAGWPNWEAADNLSQRSSKMIVSIIAHAHTLEKLAQHEPEPVDADEAALGRILNAFYGYSPDNKENYSSAMVDRALAQYKAERPSLSDDEALLIAREICARVADEVGSYSNAKSYRASEYNADPEVQFALAMVKRDPAALEAFRGVGRG
jgi:hypothetical protein